MKKCNHNRSSKFIQFRGYIHDKGAALIMLLFMLVAFLLACIPFAHAQTSNTFHVVEFRNIDQGIKTVGQMTTAAQASCHSDTAIPCVLWFDPILAKYATGSMPTQCANCLWLDFRTPGQLQVGALSSANNSFVSPTMSNPTITGTATATGATITGPSLTSSNLLNGTNSNTLLGEVGPSAAITGTAADVTVCTTPALSTSILTAAKGFRATISFIHSTGTASTTYKLKYGATIIESTSYAPFNTTGTDVFQYVVFNNAGVQNAQHWTRFSIVNSGAAVNVPGVTVGTSTADFSASAALLWTMNVAATDQITPKHCIFEAIL
jgi:hypothetical protein